jgi:hypothetical protein
MFRKVSFLRSKKNRYRVTIGLVLLAAVSVLLGFRSFKAYAAEVKKNDELKSELKSEWELLFSHATTCKEMEAEIRWKLDKIEELKKKLETCELGKN